MGNDDFVLAPGQVTKIVTTNADAVEVFALNLKFDWAMIPTLTLWICLKLLLLSDAAAAKQNKVANLWRPGS